MAKYQVAFQEQEKGLIKETEVEAAAYLVENGDLTFFGTVEGTNYSDRVASFRWWLSVVAIGEIVGSATKKSR